MTLSANRKYTYEFIGQSGLFLYPDIRQGLLLVCEYMRMPQARNPIARPEL